MQLWTHHPSTFRLDLPDAKVYPERGDHWQMEAKGFRYPQIARKLWQVIGTNQFLWCCTSRGGFVRTTEAIDLVEWEIAAPPSTILAFINAYRWEDLVWSRSDDWNGLILQRAPSRGDRAIHALVAVPLPPGAANCRGQLPPQVTRAREEEVRNMLKRPHDQRLAEQYDY
jgi:hypothetical protein